MTRSFSGYFKPSIRGKKRCFPSTKQLKVTTKNTAISFFLLPRNTSHTPLPAHASWFGEKTVTLPEDGDHTKDSDSWIVEKKAKLKSLNYKQISRRGDHSPC
ncbi:hypothetical protein ATANTOWER_023839 [Ataeniobius toweri]|uniref:Uncharacterized protein n=1 Tax=Ataeniobius toweri TaxID=208326 RepID=A0ABU7A8K9_9TELE|nr:hypothetical protein [Ataeniobius toweri]